MARLTWRSDPTASRMLTGIIVGSKSKSSSSSGVYCGAGMEDLISSEGLVICNSGSLGGRGGAAVWPRSAVRLAFGGDPPGAIIWILVRELPGCGPSIT